MANLFISHKLFINNLQRFQHKSPFKITNEIYIRNYVRERFSLISTCRLILSSNEINVSVR